MRRKISVIGAGNVGREVASWCAVKELGDIVLWNRTPEKAIGTALDLSESSPLIGFDSKILGTGNLADTKNSDIIVFASGSSRKPGMKREELVAGNAEVVVKLIKKLSRLSPSAIIVMVTNPLDAMTYAALKSSGFPKKRVIGMAGILDLSRFKSFIARELRVSVEEISALVIGTHGEDMVPLSRFATVGGVSLSSLLPKSKIEKLEKHTKESGAEIVRLLKANASFSVGASAARLVESILKDKREILPCSVYLQKEYGINGICIGVPCVIGSNGLEEIVEVKLNSVEKAKFKKASESVRRVISAMKSSGIL